MSAAVAAGSAAGSAVGAAAAAAAPAAAAVAYDDDATKEVKEEEKEQAFSFTSFFVFSFASSQLRLSSHPACHRDGESGEVDDDDMDGHQLQWGKCSCVLLHN